MTVKDDTSAFFNALQSCWDAGERGEHDGKNPLGPPSREVAWQETTLCGAAITGFQVLEVYCGASRLPDDRPAPRCRHGASREAQREPAEIVSDTRRTSGGRFVDPPTPPLQCGASGDRPGRAGCPAQEAQHGGS